MKNMSQPDPSISPEKSSNYHLSIEIGAHCCAFSILDISGNIYRYLSVDVFSGKSDDSLENKFLQTWFSSHDILHWNFRSSSIAYINRFSTLVPEPLTDINHMDKYIRFNFCIDANIIPYCDTLNTQGMKNLYALEKNMAESVLKSLDRPRVFHHSSVLINSALKSCRNRSGNFLFLQFEQSFFTTLAVSGKSLSFINSFQYESPEDVVYYSLCVCEQLNFDAPAVEVILSGWIDSASPVYSLLYRYFGNIGFIKPYQSYKVSPHLTEVPAHRFCRLFDQYFNI